MESRWPGLTDPGHSHAYIERFRRMSESGNDIAGEARLVDAMVGRGSRILDAGCGPGRLAGYLAAVGHDVVGLDIDPLLIEAAERDYSRPRYLVGDVAHLDRAALGDSFDAVICAGNVMVFLAPETEVRALSEMRAVLVPDGFAIVGFHVARYPVATFDDHARTAGFVVEQRFATWDVRPWTDDADFAVTILRNPKE